jgi:hypothetical protein
VFLGGIYGSKRVTQMWKMMKEVVIQDLTEPIKMLKKCRIWCIQTVNQAYYVEILKWLYEAVHRKRPKCWHNDWILHHDNAAGHKVLSVKQFVAQKLVIEPEHPSYSPSLALNDFWLFPKIKSALEG